jgi:opacity protein-like surface antigen
MFFTVIKQTINVTNKNIMRKHTFKFIVLLLLVGNLVTAQNLSFGPMVGLNLTNLSNNSNTSTKAGLLAGGFFNYSSKNWFGVGVQFLYNQMGAKVVSPAEEINLNYLQVPVLFTYYFEGQNKPGSFRPKLFAGPHANFLLNAKNKEGNDLNPNSIFFKETEFGVTLGAGFNYALQNQMWINVDGRYGIGLTDATQAPNTNSSNRGFGLTVGLSFPLGSI